MKTQNQIRQFFFYSIICFLFNIGIIQSQTEQGINQNSIVYIQKQNLLQWNDLVYTNNFRGLRNLMNDVKKQDEALYKKLEDDFQELDTRNQNAMMISIVGGIIGTGLLTVGILKPIENTTQNVVPSSHHHQNLSSGPPSGTSEVIGGISVLILTGIIYAIQSVKAEDILSFRNTFNQHSSSGKLQLTVTPFKGLSIPTNIGLGTCWTF